MFETVGEIAGAGTGEPGVVGGPLGPGDDPVTTKKIMNFLQEKSRLSNRLGIRAENQRGDRGAMNTQQTQEMMDVGTQGASDQGTAQAIVSGGGSQMNLGSGGGYS